MECIPRRSQAERSAPACPDGVESQRARRPRRLAPKKLGLPVGGRHHHFIEGDRGPAIEGRWHQALLGEVTIASAAQMPSTARRGEVRG
jgi:hypothetical protein